MSVWWHEKTFKGRLCDDTSPSYTANNMICSSITSSAIFMDDMFIFQIQVRVQLIFILPDLFCNVIHVNDVTQYINKKAESLLVNNRNYMNLMFYLVILLMGLCWISAILKIEADENATTTNSSISISIRCWVVCLL